MFFGLFLSLNIAEKGSQETRVRTTRPAGSGGPACPRAGPGRGGPGQPDQPAGPPRGAHSGRGQPGAPCWARCPRPAERSGGRRLRRAALRRAQRGAARRAAGAV